MGVLNLRVQLHEEGGGEARRLRCQLVVSLLRTLQVALLRGLSALLEESRQLGDIDPHLLSHLVELQASLFGGLEAFPFRADG